MAEVETARIMTYIYLSHPSGKRRIRRKAFTGYFAPYQILNELSLPVICI